MTEAILQAVLNGVYVSFTPSTGPNNRVEGVRIGVQAQTWNGVCNLNRILPLVMLTDAAEGAEALLSRTVSEMAAEVRK